MAADATRKFFESDTCTPHAKHPDPTAGHILHEHGTSRPATRRARENRDLGSLCRKFVGNGFDVSLHTADPVGRETMGYMQDLKNEQERDDAPSARSRSESATRARAAAPS